MLKQITKAFLLLMWLVVGSILYSVVRVNLRYSGYGNYFPSYPKFLEKLLEYTVSPDKCCEDWHLISAFAYSFFHILILTFIAFAVYFAYKHFKNKSR